MSNNPVALTVRTVADGSVTLSSADGTTFELPEAFFSFRPHPGDPMTLSLSPPPEPVTDDSDLFKSRLNELIALPAP